MPLPAFTGWGYSKDLPRFAGKTFRERFVPKPGMDSEDFKPRSERTTATSGDVAVQAGNNLERFTSELTALSGHVHLTNDPTQAVIEHLNSRGIRKIYLQPAVLGRNKS